MKSAEQIKRFREMSVQELRQTLSSHREEMMNYRFRKASGQLPNSSAVEAVRRQIARAETVLKEMVSKGGK